MLPPTDPKAFGDVVRQALEKDYLKGGLGRATALLRTLRRTGAADFGEFETLRVQARDVKDKTLARLDYYLAKLEDNVSARGGHVFWAVDGQEVVNYILELAKSRRLSKVVKGKSMVSEEIRLNTYLEQAGLEVLETDLGEFIIQLTGEKPAHILGPAIHKTRQEIGRLFAEKLGHPYSDVPAELTQMARARLRNNFLTADLGITGVNLAVAETGTLVLLENEGNIRMSTTLPRVHVAIMGLEKIVPCMADLAVLLRILPLSATGQRLPAYVSWLHGPGRTQGEGPEEFHLIILDNFRTRLLADPILRPMLRCLRCAACLNFCPIYQRLSGHSYPSVYSGPMGVILTAASHGLDTAQNVIQACTLCQACKQVCPVMIDLPGLILELRRRLTEEDQWAGGAVDLLARFLATPAGFDLATSAMALMNKTAFDRQGQPRWPSDKLQALAEGRHLPVMAERPFHKWFNKD